MNDELVSEFLSNFDQKLFDIAQSENSLSSLEATHSMIRSRLKSDGRFTGDEVVFIEKRMKSYLQKYKRNLGTNEKSGQLSHFFDKSIPIRKHEH